VVHWGGRKRQNATWKAWQKKKPLVLNVHFTLFEDSATRDAVPRLRPLSGRQVSQQGHADQPQKYPRQSHVPTSRGGTHAPWPLFFWTSLCYEIPHMMGFF